MRTKIGVLLNNATGKGYYRIKLPYEYIKHHYKEDFEVNIFKQVPITSQFANEFVSHHHIIVLQGTIDQLPNAYPNILKHSKLSGRLAIYDIDDMDWDVPKENPSYHFFKEANLEQTIKQCIIEASVITTTTTKFANEIRQFNSNVKVFPNALDYDYYYWNLPKKDDGFVRVAYIGGSSHIEDLKLIKGLGKWIITNFDNTKFILGGYDSKIIGPTMAGTRLLSYDDSSKNIWWHYKKLLFGEPKDVDWSRIEILRTRMVEIYPILFRDVDIILAPLLNNKFNSAKSELKIVEASSVGVPVIASNIWEYKNCILQGINGYIANNITEWKTFLTKLIQDKELREKIGKNLQKRFKKTYSIEVQAQARVDYFNNFMKTFHKNEIATIKRMEDEIKRNEELRKNILMGSLDKKKVS